MLLLLLLSLLHQLPVKLTGRVCRVRDYFSFQCIVM
jgi:hypothetical protein